MSAHTPGPWTIRREDGDRYLESPGHFGALMCDTQYYPWTPDSDEDWNLIAAAPELLEALIEIRRHPWALPEPVVNQMDAAIAKARGKS
jgi:hypothetical protein